MEELMQMNFSKLAWFQVERFVCFPFTTINMTLTPHPGSSFNNFHILIVFEERELRILYAIITEILARGINSHIGQVVNNLVFFMMDMRRHPQKV
jgi:hypothetical protein